MKEFNIIGVGDADVDIMLKVDRLPRHDEKLSAQLLGKFPGGMVANFCCAASNFGAKTGIVTTVGQDEYGRMAISDLQRHGVDASHVVVKEGEDTYFSIAHLDPSGEKAMTVCLTSATMPDNEDVDLEYVEKADFVQLMGANERLSLHVGAYAKAHGVKVSYDIEAAAGNHSLDTRRKMMSYAYIAFFNKEGLHAFTGCESIAEGAKKVLPLGPKIVVVTQGAAGADIFTAEESIHQDALKVLVCDTTGAGDCFNGVFLACLCKGYPLRKCARMATGAAALAVQQVGSRSGYRPEQQVAEYLEQYSTAL